MVYNLELEIYSGPMELLIELIKKDEMDIYDIQINKITDEFLNYIEIANSINLELTSEFLIMASTLVEIKSKMLLPVEITQEDEILTDPRDELVKRIVEYKKYKEISEIFEEFEKKEKNAYYKLKEESIEISDIELLKDANIMDLRIAFESILKRTKNTAKKNIYRESFSTEDAILRIKDAINFKKMMTFGELITENMPKIDIITLFLALLELIKINYLRARQLNFIDIRMEVIE